ncbi:M56 family metallopeptidase [Flavobacterium sp. NKUCC04_CG]|uniref:M56 family metallopeptidase n=1 Tax=Flavobacterium sp. NKUCC04_CG TaxID=2842121 RepID=UPI001C5A79C5|nr:M56 family metallopeptidase [Flavobacterium sp. NKUCC04_CG]MBW3520338.1 hypothetical protein [Flavobacterium sp. NKUCC04_CG]
MEALFLYILKVNLLLIVFYIIYKALLEKTTFYVENRYYFLISTVLSFVLPLFYITKTVWVPPKVLEGNEHVAWSGTELTSQLPTLLLYLLMTAIIISITLLFRLLLNINKINTLIKSQPPIVKKRIRYYDHVQHQTPFSFWNNLFYNSKNYDESELEVILLHEETHIKQKHSFDLLFIQSCCCLFWFNPWLWKTKTAVIRNLEFLTDQAVLQKTQQKARYQKTLLKTMGISLNNELTHSFNQSFLKMRIMKINQNQTQKLQRWRFSLPLCGALIFIFLFQVRTIAQVQQNSINVSKPQENPVITASPAGPPKPPQAPLTPNTTDIPTPSLTPVPEAMPVAMESNDYKNGDTTPGYTVSSHHTREATQQEIAVARKDAEIARKDAEAAKREAEAAKRDAEAVKRDAEAVKRDAEAVKRDVEAAKRDAEAVKRDAEAAKRDAIAAQKDAETARKEIALAKKERIIKQRDIDISKTNRMAAERNRKAAEMNKQATLADKAAYEKNKERAKQNVKQAEKDFAASKKAIK